jgi:RNA polymerase sigma factor (TIGR02999 family)
LRPAVRTFANVLFITFSPLFETGSETRHAQGGLDLRLLGCILLRSGRKAAHWNKRRFLPDSLTRTGFFWRTKMASPDQPAQQAVTRLLRELCGGRKEAFDELVPLVYDPLRRLAARCLAAERPGHTLRATALVHEAYLRLVTADAEWQDRIHFYAVAARVMRRILVDYARGQARQKRGGGADKVSLDDAVIVGGEVGPDLLDLDFALEKLARQDARKSQIVELLFFGGLTYEESAAALNISPATLHRELKMAKAWLYRELGENQAQHGSGI